MQETLFNPAENLIGSDARCGPLRDRLNGSIDSDVTQQVPARLGPN